MFSTNAFKRTFRKALVQTFMVFVLAQTDRTETLHNATDNNTYSKFHM